MIRSSYGQAQTTSDTICLDVTKYKKVYTAALQKKVVDSLLYISTRQLSELKSQIELLEEKEQELKNNYQRQIDNLNSQIAIYTDQVKGYEALVKKERRKRRLITATGILTTGAAIFLSLKK